MFLGFFFNDLKYLGSRLALVNLCSIKCFELLKHVAVLFCGVVWLFVLLWHRQRCSAVPSDSDTYPVNLQL